MKHWTPPLRNYRDFDSEKPPRPPSGETPEQRIKRVLGRLPPAYLRDPKMMLKALKRAARG